MDKNVEILDKVNINFKKDDSNELIKLYKDIVEYIDYLNKNKVIETNEDDNNGSK